MRLQVFGQDGQEARGSTRPRPSSAFGGGILRFFRRLPAFAVRQDGKIPVSRIGSRVPLSGRNHRSMRLGRSAQSATTFKGSTAGVMAVFPICGNPFRGGTFPERTAGSPADPRFCAFRPVSFQFNNGLRWSRQGLRPRHKRNGLRPFIPGRTLYGRFAPLRAGARWCGA
jgi:hypothetical protein